MQDRSPATMERNERLQKARRQKGYEQAIEAARAYGWNVNTYISNENGNAGFSWEKAKTYAKAFGVRPEWLFEGQGPERGKENETVRIVGYVGADPSGTVLYATGQESYDTVPLPPNGSPTARALEVRGYSMPFFADDGSVIYFDDQHTHVPKEWLGHVVVVELDTDEVLVKRILRGSEPGLYELESLGAPPRRDVRVRWVAVITAVVPPLEARRMIQRGSAAA